LEPGTGYGYLSMATAGRRGKSLPGAGGRLWRAALVLVPALDCGARPVVAMTAGIHNNVGSGAREDDLFYLVVAAVPS
jgi:hypothetical protein